jgi:hypothetical protein
LTYLGSEITRDRGTELDVKTHILKENLAFIQLHKICKAEEICNATTLGIFKTNVNLLCSMDVRVRSAEIKFSRVCKLL